MVATITVFTVSQFLGVGPNGQILSTFRNEHMLVNEQDVMISLPSHHKGL